jgi:microcystin-dependent protein
MVYEHRIPETLTPTGTITVPVSIPHDPMWVGLLLGALRELEQVDYYQRDTDYDNEGAKTVVAQWRDRTITPLIQAIADGETCGATMTFPTGSGMQFFGSVAPDGWLFCDGSAVSRATYADLFAVIGTTYGAGDGSTTFNLPDFRGRAGIGAGTGTGLTSRALGAKVGAETHQLTTSEIPSHYHDAGLLTAKVQATGGSNTTAAGGSANGGGSFNGAIGGQTATAGGGGTHNNMQPSLVCNFIIKV